MTVTIKYLLSEEGRKAALRAGTNAKKAQTLQVTKDDPVYDRALSLAQVDDNGVATVDVGVTLRNSNEPWKYHAQVFYVEQILYNGPPNSEQLVTDEENRRQRLTELVEAHKLEARREEEERKLRYMENPAEFIYNYEYDGKWSLIDKYKDDRRLDAARQEARTLIEKHNREWEERQEEKERQEEAERERQRQDMLAWIQNHGSERLKLCVAEGIECDTAYRDERLAKERPGWEWAESDLETDDPRNPPMEAFDLLQEARKTDQAAKLYYCVSDDERYYAAVADFLGYEIVLSAKAYSVRQGVQHD